jgi:hypothetical protein
MAVAGLGYFDYLKAAFHRRVDVPMLGHIPLNKMALGVFAVLGIANPGFWLLGLAVEATYLVGIGGNPRFQKVIEGERLLAAQEGWEGKVQSAVERLSPPGRARYRELLGKCRLILGIGESLGGDSLGNVRDLRAQNLNQLLWIFLRLLGSRELIADNVNNVDRKALSADVERLQQRIASVGKDADDALTKSLQGTLAIQKKRQENLDRAAQSLDVIDAELERIEQQVELIREESAVSGSPQFLSARLDAVTSTMSETSKWMDEHADFFGSLAADEEASPAPTLPNLPQSESQ